MYDFSANTSSNYDSAIHGLFNKMVNSNSYPEGDMSWNIDTPRSGNIKMSEGRHITQYSRKPILLDVKNALKKAGIVADSAKGLKVMVYNAMLTEFAKLAYDIKNKMRIDTGIMAASWGIHDKNYIVNNLRNISSQGRNKIGYNPAQSVAISKKASVWYAKMDLRKNTPIIFQQGTLVDWLRYNEYVHGDKKGNRFFIEQMFIRYRPRFNKAVRNTTKKYIKIMQSNRLKKKFTVPIKYDYTNTALMRRLGETI